MSYKLAFHPQALREWKKLDGTLQTQLKKKLAERLKNPHVPSDRLTGHPCRYKIKLRQSGYRLVYEVKDQQLIVVVLAIRKRERSQIYRQAHNRH
ncbi:mRNA interferase RelE/StbE [Sulfurivirga caldicuralii]|uniref:mRNA interferase RelE/StbE n=1 Tax=Sulfurivirga caldicuralii TaxID=364032 RepID=A0A1N6H7E7_9GAMM|nr:type II toxin-antitoxin system RelE/ParE family toxin [Sulfurivirga caldicuralii]SIO15660.1 mRNA interferase RelE/StbE [Sulfurivirga caldicuralii]